MLRANPFRLVGTLAQCGPRPDDVTALERRRALAMQNYAPRSIINAGARFYRVPGLKPGPVPTDSRLIGGVSKVGGASQFRVNRSP